MAMILLCYINRLGIDKMDNKHKPPLIYVLFIGGAADKESFLWGNINIPFTDRWPHHTMQHVADNFNQKLAQAIHQHGYDSEILLTALYRADYLSYSDIFYEELKDIDDKFAQIQNIIDDKFHGLLNQISKETHVYIVGHSLGGWNGAHLSRILAEYGIKTDYLVTLDPVGTGNHETLSPSLFIKQAQIYKPMPKPVAQQWINIRGYHIQLSEGHLSKNFVDWVAWAGGQWLLDQSYHSVINILTDITHQDANQMFNLPILEGKSASELLLESIIQVITDRSDEKNGGVSLS